QSTSLHKPEAISVEGCISPLLSLRTVVAEAFSILSSESDARVLREQDIRHKNMTLEHREIQTTIRRPAARWRRAILRDCRPLCIRHGVLDSVAGRAHGTGARDDASRLSDRKPAQYNTSLRARARLRPAWQRGCRAPSPWAVKQRERNGLT
ncbi:hypothetical protein POSPLADRAFT_1139143, partial [Postia placenta MAD-698-R-SB12]